MKNLILVFLLCITFQSIIAQNDYQLDNPKSSENQEWQNRKNIVKFVPTSLIVRNFQFQYERVLNKTFSVALGYSLIPEGDFPFKDFVLESVDDDEDVGRYINDAKLKYSSFTPEIRIYLGEGYGKGFYIAPFYRHSSYKVKNIKIFYDGDNSGEQQMDTNGDLKTDTFGLLFGAQFKLGSRITLDWFILGPNYGFSNGNLVGIAEQPFSENEQQNLREELDDIDLPIGDFSYEVDSNGAKIKIDGPWGGIRAGIAIGFRF